MEEETQKTKTVILDISTLGMKTVMRREMTTVTDPISKMESGMKFVNIPHQEQDPILSLEDAQKIPDEYWEELEPGHPHFASGKWRALVAGRRFWCKENPLTPDDDEPIKATNSNPKISTESVDQIAYNQMTPQEKTRFTKAKNKKAKDDKVAADAAENSVAPPPTLDEALTGK